MRQLAIPLLFLGTLGVFACDRTTARLTPQQEQRFASEGIVRRADDVVFRFTQDPGGRRERWENRRASIVVTKSTVFLHKNEKIGLTITSRTRRDVAVERTGDRVRIRSGRGRSEEIWSFQPPDDAEGWTRDIRSVINPPPPPVVKDTAVPARKSAKKGRKKART